jgi:hypothetical protein
MRLPRIRLTVRRMMLATSLLAMVLGGFVMRQRAVAFRERVSVYDKCEEGCFRYYEQISKNLKVLETGRGGQAELDAAKNLESFLIVRRWNRGDPITAEDMARRFVRTISPDRIATLRKLGHEEVDFYLDLAKSHRANRHLYENAARYPWLPVPPKAPEPK